MRITLSTLALISLSLLPFSSFSYADKLCLQVSLKKNTNKISTKSTIAATCPKGYKELIDTASFVGPRGANGASGADGTDGQLALYGDGSLGALTISSFTDWNTTLPTAKDLQYTNVTIESGQTLLVPSGTVIRCTGSFVNNGSIVVSAYAKGGSESIGASLTGISGLISPVISRPGEGVLASSPASEGELGDANFLRGSGIGGSGALSTTGYEAFFLSPKGPLGGSGGAGNLLGSTGGSGGGNFLVFAEGAITNSGDIVAIGTLGQEGAGGGGGGNVMLASAASLTVSGVINVDGGLGGQSKEGFSNGLAVGPGGGGGGGLVSLISPSITTTGATILLFGGSGGVASSVNGTLHQGGAGGGAGYGAGGNGGQMGTGNPVTPGAATAGASGKLFTTTASPSSLF